MAAIASERNIKNAEIEAEMKVGINCGSVEGAVLGKCRRFYCVYGDTINTAARMAANARPGCITLSAELFERAAAGKVLTDFEVSSESKEVKGKGKMTIFHACRRDDVAPPPCLQAPELGDRAWQIVKCSLEYPGNAAPWTNRHIDEGPGDVGAVSKPSAYKISWWRNEFEDAGCEAAFQAAQIPNDRVSITAGLILHFTCVVWQAIVVLHPSPAGYFQAYGQPELTRAMRLVSLALQLHSIVSVLVSLAILVLLWRRHIFHDLRSRAPGCGEQVPGLRELCSQAISAPTTDTRTARVCVYGYVGLKVVHFGVSILCMQLWKVQTCSLFVFATGIMTNFGLGHCNYGVPFRVNLLLAIATAVVTGVVYFGAGIATRAATNQLGAQLLGTLVLSAAVCRSKRQLWSRLQSHRLHLHELTQILFDLVPPSFARQLVRGIDRPPATRYRVIHCVYMYTHAAHARRARATHAQALTSTHKHAQTRTHTHTRTQTHTLSHTHRTRVVALQLDICGYTALSRSHSPAAIASILSTLFSSFDETVMAHKLYKVCFVFV